MSFFKDHIIKEYKGNGGCEGGGLVLVVEVGGGGAKVRGVRCFFIAELLSGSVGDGGNLAATPSP